MVSYFVRYRGASSDPDAFHSYYETRHATLLRRLPGIRSLVLHRPASCSDPFPVEPGGTLLLAQMQFDSARYLDRVDPKVTIRRGALGAFYLDIEGDNRSPRVKRVQ